MEFTELKRMLNDLEIQEDVLTDKGIQTLHELKIIFKQRDGMLRTLDKVLKIYGKGYEPKENVEDTIGSLLYKEIKQLIEEATKID